MEAAVLRPAGPRQHPMVNALRTVAVASTGRRAIMPHTEGTRFRVAWI
jgi:hypothetical protein